MEEGDLVEIKLVQDHRVFVHVLNAGIELSIQGVDPVWTEHAKNVVVR
jgi:hypothetical protein